MDIRQNKGVKYRAHSMVIGSMEKEETEYVQYTATLVAPKDLYPLVFMCLCSKSFPHHLKPCLHMTCFGQWEISKDDTRRDSINACILEVDLLECFFLGSQPLWCKEPWARLLNQRCHIGGGPGVEEAILDVETPAKIPVEFSCSQTTEVDQNLKLWWQKSYCPSKLANLSGFLLSHPQKLASERGDL